MLTGKIPFVILSYYEYGIETFLAEFYLILIMENVNQYKTEPAKKLTTLLKHHGVDFPQNQLLTF